jgi:hypothetical protein
MTGHASFPSGPSSKLRGSTKDGKLNVSKILSVNREQTRGNVASPKNEECILLYTACEQSQMFF